MDIIAGIVTFNPKIDELLEEISSLLELHLNIVIVDNHSENIEKIKNSLKVYIEKNIIQFISNNRNQGIAYAHNQILQYAYENEFAWVLTMDQDSLIPYNILDEYYKYMKKDIGIICPAVTYLVNNNIPKENIFSAEYEECDWAIASASLINVDVWRKV